MNARRPRVLFISHAASRNGATILMLSFLRWLRPRVDWQFEIVVNGRGPLLDDFRAIGRTTVWRDPEARIAAIWPRSPAALRSGVAASLASLVLPHGDFDLVYANTTAAAPIVGLLGTRARAVLWHVHELDYAVDSTLINERRLQDFRAATRHVAVSAAVRDYLRDGHRIDPARIDLVHGFVEAPPQGSETTSARSARIRSRLGIQPDSFVVGACGSMGWRKGSDIFVQIASRLDAASYDLGRNLSFLWVGGNPGDPAVIEFEHDVRRLGLSSRCHLVLATPDAVDFYDAMDVLALTSREDPFPLVVLEAADRGLPVVCFEGAGGAVEFVGDDAGLTAPYLDVEGFAHALARLVADPSLAAQLGERGQRKVERLHRVASQAPSLLRAMERCLGVGQPQAEASGPDDVDRHAAVHPR